MPLRTEHQELERPLMLDDDWEVGLVTPHDGDRELLSALLNQEAVIDAFGSVPWPVTFSLLSLADPDWISVRHKHRFAPWVGVVDRASKGVALLWNVPLPMSAEPGTLSLVYGSRSALEKLRSTVAALANVAVERIRVTATPRDERHLEADVVIEGEAFIYAITWRGAKT
jgi:hypothetical protein